MRQGEATAMMRGGAGAGGAGNGDDVDLSELYFLVSDFLARATPCQRAAQALREELTEHGLLGLAYDWQGQTHAATQQDVALRYRRLPSDQLPRLLGAALRAGATEDGAAAAAGGGGGQQAHGPALTHGRHGRGATLGVFGASNVRVASILSAVRGDETSHEEAARVRRGLARALSELAQASSQLRRVRAAIARAKEEAVAAEREARMARELDALLGARAATPTPQPQLPSPSAAAAAASGAVGPSEGEAAADAAAGAMAAAMEVVDASLAVTASGKGEETGGVEGSASPAPPEAAPAADVPAPMETEEGGHGPQQPKEAQEEAEAEAEGDAAAAPAPAPPEGQEAEAEEDGTPAAAAAAAEEQEQEQEQELVHAPAGNDDADDPDVVVVVVEEDDADVGAASRARVERELSERVAGLTAEVARLLGKARLLRALRTQATHEACRTLPDVVLRRQALPNARMLPARARPPTCLYGRLRHLKTVNGHFSCPVYCIKYDRRGTHVVTGSDDQLVKIWSARSGWLMRSLRGHSGVITDLSLSSDNSLLATASEDGTVRIWATRDGAPLALLRGHTDTINYVHFHPFYNLLITGSDDGTARAWDLGPLKETTRELPERQAAIAPLLPPDASAALPAPTVLDHVTSTTPGAAAAAAAAAAADAEAGEAPRAKVKCISVSPLGTHIATGGDDGVGRVWSIAALERAGGRGAELEAAEARVAAALGATDGQRLTARQRAAAAAAASGASASPSAAAAAAAQQEGGVPASPPGALVCRLVGHKNVVTDINYSYGGDRIFTGSMTDNAARVWTWGPGYTDLTSVLLDGTAVGAGDAGLEPGVSAAGAAGAGAGGADGEGTRKKKKEPQEEINNAIWACDDRRIMTVHSTRPPNDQQQQAGADGPDGDGGGGNWKQNVKVWDPETGALLRVLRGHRRQCSVLVAHPTEGRVLLSAGYDGRVCLWDVETGAQLLSFLNVQEWGPVGTEYNLGDPVALVDGQFAPDGSSFTVTDGAGRLLLFGSADKGRFESVFPEQYFVGDYDQLQWDTNGNVIDTMHQVAPHLLGRRALTNAERAPYQEQPTYDLTGPRPLSRDEALAAIRAAADKARAVDRLLEARAAAAAKALARLPSRTMAGTGDRGRIHTLQDVRKGRRRRDDDDFAYDWRSDGESGSEPEMVGGRPLSRAERYQRRRLGQIPAHYEEGEGGESGAATGRLRRQRQQDNARARAERRRRRLRAQGHDEWLAGGPPDSDSEWSGGGGRRLGGSDSEEEQDAYGWDDSDSDYRGGRGGGGGGRRRGRPRSGRSAAAGGAAEAAAAEAAEEPVPEGPGDAYGPIDPRAQGLPVELDEFDTTIVATTLMALPPPAGGGEGGEGAVAASASASASAASPGPGPAAAAASSGGAAGAGGVTEVDRRSLSCAMCKKGHSEDFPLPGPVLGSHPLKLRDRPVWVHDECARWSPQTFIGQEDDRWYNIAVEVRRGRQTRCFACKQSGATIGCHCPACSRSYHYQCAVNTGFAFTPEEFFRCPVHRERARAAAASAGGAAGGGRRARTTGGTGRRGRPPKRRRADEEDEEEEDAEEEGVAMVIGGGDLVDGQWFPSPGMELAREWLRATAPEHDVTGVLVPQKGDSVVYFPRAHYEAAKALEAARSAHLKGPGKGAGASAEEALADGPWHVFSLGWTAVRCRVESVEYLFPADEAAYRAAPSVVARVTLAPTGALHYQEAHDEIPWDESTLPEGAWTFDKVYGPGWKGFTFQVDVRKQLSPGEDGSPPTPFLALEACFLAAINHPWHAGLRVKAPVLEAGRGGRAARRTGFVFGTVKAVARQWLPLYWNPVDEDTAPPGTLHGWGAYRWLDVVWDEGVEGRKPAEMNAWEVLPIHAAEGFPFWRAPALSPEEKACALAALRPLAEEELYLPFVPPVPFDEFPSYPLLIPLPMEYMLILDRLEGGTYYRSLAAVEADVRLVAHDCGLFNQEGAPIVMCAKQMMDAAVAALRKAKSSGGARQQQQAAAAAAEAGLRRSGRDSKRRTLESQEAEAAEEAAEMEGGRRSRRAAASRYAVKAEDEEEEDGFEDEEDDDSVGYGSGKRKRGANGHAHSQQSLVNDDLLLDGSRRGSERLATSRAIAASLAEAALDGADGAGGRASRRAARAAPVSPAPTQRRLKIVMSSDDSYDGAGAGATPSPTGRANGHGGARGNVLRIRLRPLAEGEMDDSGAGAAAGGDDDEEEEEDEAPPAAVVHGLDASGGSAGPDGGGALGRGMRRSRMRKGEDEYPEPLPGQRAEAIDALLDKLVAADDYQVLPSAETEAAAAAAGAAGAPRGRTPRRRCRWRASGAGRTRAGTSRCRRRRRTCARCSRRWRPRGRQSTAPRPSGCWGTCPE